MAKVIKEIVIMLLICLVTMLVLAIVLYKYIPNRKVVPEVVTYTASEDVQDLLEDNVDSNSSGEDNVILTYEVTATDLKGYQSTNTYVPGKSNPFAAASSSVSTDDSSSSDNNTSDKGQTNPNTSNESTVPNIYKNNGTK